MSTKKKRTRRKKLVKEEPVNVTVTGLKEDESLLLMDGEPEVVVMPLNVPTINVDDFKQWLTLAPIAEGELTLQWYGTIFVPHYKRWLQKGQQLVK